tara:strand:+ start:662 stop:1033 length:372 start_codon:yes stop_codon:yes gene_type:complete
MELDCSENEKPLLGDDDGYDDINSMSIIDKLRCVSYKKIHVKKKTLGKNKTYLEDRVKVIQENKYVVPQQFVYENKDKVYMSGDYVSVLLLDCMKKMKQENNYLKDTVNKLQVRLTELESKMK